MSTTYIPRIVDTELDKYLATFPAVCIEGPKWCGKTTTATMHAASSISLTDPEGNFRNRTMAQLEPSLAMQGPEPRLIDEWQEVPAIWDTVRFICDANPTHGRFLLTGSATPRQSQQPMHSGAGRIARLRMSSMTLAEQGRSSSEVSLRGLFDGQPYTAQSNLTLEQISQYIVRGGWPAALELDDPQASLTAEGYLDAIAHEDISEVDNTNRDPVRVQRLLASLGRNEATLASKATLLKDTTGQAHRQRTARTTRTSQLAETTLNEYMGALERMHVVEDVPAWAPALRSPVRIRSTRKHHLADPSLAAAAIGATTDTLRTDPKTLGFLFESLATHDLMVYARAIDAHVMHYRDDSHLEVDLIVEMRDGRWGAFEVKLGSTQIEDGAANVNALDRKMRERGQQPASVKAVIVGTGAIAHRRDDGVQIIPLDTLGV